MPTLIAETGSGSASSNSYCTVVYADSYAQRRLHADDWLAEQDQDRKHAALMWATRLLDSRLRWRGTRGTSTQALGWPRNGAYQPDLLSTGVYGADGILYANNVVPAPVKDATAELAILLSREDRPAAADVGGISSITLGRASASFNGVGSSDVLPESVRSILRHLIDENHYLFRV